MTGRPLVAALFVAAGVGLVSPACHSVSRPAAPPAISGGAPTHQPNGLPAAATPATLSQDLDRIFDDPVLARALVAVRVDALGDGRVLYARNSDMLVMPASNMKIVTMSVAADRLGWNFRYETRLETAGAIDDGVLTGDLIVVGGGDPSIGSHDSGSAELFTEWGDALGRAGIRRIDGRIIGDDHAFDAERLGAGWAWDYLSAGYAAPTSGLSYNEDVAVLHVSPGGSVGAPATVQLNPPGHLLDVENDVTTSDGGSTATIDLARAPGSARLVVSGQIPLAGAPVIRTAAVDDPTRYFVEALRLALVEQGIAVTGAAVDIDEAHAPPGPNSRRVIARHESEPLSSLVEYAMKVSQNFYGETLFKTIGRTAEHPGSASAARDVVRATLASWGVPPDALVMYDGSGLSRYDYVTAGAIVQILEHVWRDDGLRGPFLAAFPVGAHDGTLEARMRDPVLDRRVQAKTGTITNVRALSGYLETAAGEKLAFSMIANNVTAPGAEIDAVMDKALHRLVELELAH